LYYLLAVFTERNCNRRVTKPAVAEHFVYIYAVMFTIYSVESSKILWQQNIRVFTLFGQIVWIDNNAKSLKFYLPLHWRRLPWVSSDHVFEVLLSAINPSCPLLPYGYSYTASCARPD